jgi:hypothetical protein
MDDDSLEDSAAQEGDRETPANETPCQKGDCKPKKDFKITLKQIFEFCGGIAGILIVWAEMYGESEAGKLILYGLSLLLFYLLPCHVIYEWRTRKQAWLALLIWFLLAGVTAIFIVHNTAQPDTSHAPTVVVMPQPDYIEGTQFTHNQITDVFPFGYAVFRLQGGKCIYEPDKNQHLKVDIDWSGVKFMPDFVNKMVRFEIPSASFSIPEAAILIKDCHIGPGDEPMQVGHAYIVPVGFDFAYTEPQLYMGTLSDNELNPVFVLGFRIPQKTNQVFIRP